MAIPPSPVIAARNHEICAMFRQGSSISELATEFDLSPQRIGQVIAAQNPEEDETVDRSLYRGYLWRLFEEIRDLYRNPGWKMSPAGGTAYGPDDEPAVDVNVKIQAGELELKILESLRKLDARDRPQKKTLLLTTEADEKRLADIAQRRAEMEALARAAGQPPVIPGQVERPEIEG